MYVFQTNTYIVDCCFIFCTETAPESTTASAVDNTYAAAASAAASATFM